MAMAKNPQVDDYIQQAAPFAQPILKHLRKQVHAACPEVEEALKWGHPHFVYKGMLCHMAAFNAHCAFGFWKATLIFEGARPESRDSMGQFGRLASLKDLPDAASVRELIARAVAINEAGVPRTPKATPRLMLSAPPDLVAALARNAAAHRVFEGFSPTNRRDYIEWLTEAKTAATREKRLLQALEWIAEGKPRHWKYQKKS